MGDEEHPAYGVEEGYREYNDPGYEYAPDDANPMEDPATMKMYVARMLRARRDWDSLTPEQRFNAHKSAALEAGLAANDALDVAYELGGLPEGTAGLTTPDFTDGSTTIRVSRSEYEAPFLGSDLVDTQYHETVHAEQTRVSYEVEEGLNINPTTRELEQHRYNQGDMAAYTNEVEADPQGRRDEYMALPVEREAFGAGEAAGRMFARMGDLHDELEEVMGDRRRQLDKDAQAVSDRVNRHLLGLDKVETDPVSQQASEVQQQAYEIAGVAARLVGGSADSEVVSQLEQAIPQLMNDAQALQNLAAGRTDLLRAAVSVYQQGAEFATQVAMYSETYDPGSLPALQKGAQGLAQAAAGLPIESSGSGVGDSGDPTAAAQTV